MSEKQFKEIKKGIVKRNRRRILGVFIDGTGLDRATRRMHKRVDMPSLVRGVAAGTTPVVARYYTLIPYEDDSRQRAFLDAVRRAGLQVVVKRLPPKGITRQVSVETEMASDIVAFGLGKNVFEDIGFELGEPKEEEARKQHSSNGTSGTIPILPGRSPQKGYKENSKRTKPHTSTEAKSEESPLTALPEELGNEERIATVVCPGRELAYTFSLLRSFDIQTVSADFGQASGKELLKSASKWIDLSDSETIWRETEKG